VAAKSIHQPVLPLSTQHSIAYYPIEKSLIKANLLLHHGTKTSPFDQNQEANSPWRSCLGLL